MIGFSIRQLEYFAAVAAFGGTAPAARALNISSAALAAALAKLEDQTGLVLFDRFPAKGLELTHSGREFLGHAQKVLHQSKSLQQVAVELTSPERGKIRFGCYHALALIFAAPILKRHVAVRPGVSVTMFEDLMPELRQQALSGGIDVVLSYEDVKIADGFVVEKLLKVQPKAILPAEHPLAAGKDVSIHDLCHLPYVQVTEPDSGESFLDMFKAQAKSPPIAQDVRSFELVRSCVGAGMGFGLMAFAPANVRTYHGDALAAVPLREDIGSYTVTLGWRRELDESPLIENFRELCRDVVLNS